MPILSDNLKKELIAIEPDTLTLNMIAKLFGYTSKKGSFEVQSPKFNPRAKVHLEPNEYINEKAEDTNVGIILFNKLMIEGTEIHKVIPGGFYNEVITKKKFQKLMGFISQAVQNGELRVVPDLSQFLKAYEVWGLTLVSIFSPSYTMGMVKPNKELKKIKDETVAKSEFKNFQDMVKVQGDLVKKAAIITDGDPGKTLFDSGSRGSFDNDFKNMALFIGPTENPVTGKYDFMTSNYMDGLKKEDLVGAGNIVVNSEFPKAIGTARGGYITKQFYAVFQMLTLAEAGTDCGTTQGLRVTLTEQNASYYIDQYIMTTKGPLLISEENVSKFYNKSVLIRSTMFCISDQLCNICAGERFYKLGIDTIGLTSVNISNNLMNKNLKLRHNMKPTVNHVDIERLLL